MEFLVNSIASESDGGMLGVVLTSFDVTEYTSRAEVRLFGIEDFKREYPQMQPMGFTFNDQGVLLSDTVTRRAIASSVFSYMEEECKKFGQHVYDIIDLVLSGVDNNGFVIAEFEEAPGPGETEGHYIPLKNFRVSNSSFNIYAPYMRDDNTFRTCSLLNVEDGSGKQVYVAMPSTVDMNVFSALKPTMIKTVEFNGGETYIVYSIETALVPYYASVGEAFLNYLAYNVAFYNIGEATLKGLAPQISTVSTATAEVREYAPRKATHNVSIEHCYKDCQLQNIINRLGDTGLLEQYLMSNVEANITYQWIRKAYNSPWFNENTDGGTEQQLLATSCMNLLIDCKRERLKYALELLAHRYYICSMGMINDTLNVVLRGGGVGGEAIKRSNFGYN